MKIPRWLAVEDPAPQEFHRWEMSEHPNDTPQTGDTEEKAR